LPGFFRSRIAAKSDDESDPEQVEGVAESHYVCLLAQIKGDGDHGLVGGRCLVADAMAHEIYGQVGDTDTGCFLEDGDRVSQDVRVELLAFGEERLQCRNADGTAEVASC
jgi:hypothetical protein